MKPAHLGVLAGAWPGRFGDGVILEVHVGAWESHHNTVGLTPHRQFTSAAARTALRKLCQMVKG